jgi:membrane protein YqaA with SNARE-associated domain
MNKRQRFNKNKSKVRHIHSRHARKIKDATDKELIAIKDENKDGYIVLKQESLYKPLLVVFGIFLFVMVVLFPTSIFDQMAPEFMNLMRLLVNWAFLSSVATLLPLPVSFSDINLLRVIGNPVDFSTLYVILMVSFIVVADTFFALVAYRFTKTLRKIFANKTKEKDERKASERFKKYGNIAMFLGAATPLPFTLMVYTAGALKLPKRGFLIAVFVGRAAKYSMLAIPMRLFGFNINEWGISLWESFIVGDLNVSHYSIFGIVALLILWLSLSIVKTYKKNKK